MSKSETKEKNVLDYVGLPFPEKPPFFGAEIVEKGAYMPTHLLYTVIIPVLNPSPPLNWVRPSAFLNYQLSRNEQLEWDREKRKLTERIDRTVRLERNIREALTQIPEKPFPRLIETIFPVLNEVPTALIGISKLTDSDLSWVKELWDAKNPDGIPYFEPMTITCPPPVPTTTTNCITLLPLEDGDDDQDI